MTPVDRGPGLRELIRMDALAGNIGRRSFLFYIAAMMGLNKFSAVLLFRIAAAVHDRGTIGSILAKFLTRLNTLYNSCEMSPLARIGPGLQVPHTVGVGFGAIRAGRNLTLLQHVSLGLRDRDVDHADPDNYPTLGDGILLGPGAVILGPVHIGDGATISANAVVLQDVPAGALVIVNPAKIMRRELNSPWVSGRLRP